MDTRDREPWEKRGEGQSRRAFLRNAAGAGLAAAAGVVLLPHVGLAQSTGTTMSGATSVPFGSDIDILNYALTLERLESTFYNMNGDKSFLGTGTLQSIIAEIRAHENAHVALLTGALGANAAPAPQFQGLDAPTLAQFLTMAQTFEDVGVSAYLGAAGFIKDKGILATAAGIMAVEGRHAGGIRSYRKTVPSDNNPPDGGDATLTLTEGGEAVNRARTKDQVLALVAPFIVSTPVTAHALSISAIQVAPSVSASGDVPVSVILTNQGSSNEQFHISLFYNPGMVEINDFVDTIAAGQTMAINFTWPKAAVGAAGSRTLLVQVMTASQTLSLSQSVKVTA